MPAKLSPLARHDLPTHRLNTAEIVSAAHDGAGLRSDSAQCIPTDTSVFLTGHFDLYRQCDRRHTERRRSRAGHVSTATHAAAAFLSYAA